MYCHYTLLILLLADTGDCNDGVTVTLNGLVDVPPTNSRLTSTDPVASDPSNGFFVNLTLIPTLRVN